MVIKKELLLFAYLALLAMAILLKVHRNSPDKWTAILDILLFPFILGLTVWTIFLKESVFVIVVLSFATLISLFSVREGRIKLRLIKEGKPLVGKWYL